MGENRYQAGDIDMLREILREAESYLAAQLQCGLAADARATGFVTIVAAASAIVATAGFTLIYSKTGPALGYPALLAAFGLLVSMALASYSARPVGFSYCGNTPSAWLGDLEKGVPLKNALAEQAAHYDEHIASNNDVLRRNAKFMTAALLVAWFGLLASGIWAGVVIALR